MGCIVCVGFERTAEEVLVDLLTIGLVGWSVNAL